MGVCVTDVRKSFCLRADPLLDVMLTSYGDDFTTLDQLADQLWAVLETPSVVLVGYSYGGFVAQCMQAKQPDRVLAVVLISTLSSGELRKRHGGNSSLQHLLQFQSVQHVKDVLHNFGPTEALLWTRDQRAVLSNLLASKLPWPEIQAQLASAVHFAKVRHSAEEEAGPACPVLVIHGDADGVFGVNAARKFSKSLPNAVLVVMHGARHDIMVTHADEVRALLCMWLQMLRCDVPRPPCPKLHVSWEHAAFPVPSPRFWYSPAVLVIGCLLLVVAVVIFAVTGSTKKG